MTDALSAAIESILRADDLSEEIHQAQINNLRDAYEATLAQPVQEPVAWMFEARHIDTAFSPAVSIWHPGRENKYMRNVKPLYTAPQRKPLTEEEIEDIWNRYCDELGEASVNDALDIARAIERAHGIGGEE